MAFEGFALVALYAVLATVAFVDWPQRRRPLLGLRLGAIAGGFVRRNSGKQIG
jgi:hypothetical protein